MKTTSAKFTVAELARMMGQPPKEVLFLLQGIGVDVKSADSVLDPGTAQAIYELLFQLNRELGIAVIMVSHDQRLARRMPLRYLLEGGKLRLLAEEERAFQWEGTHG